MRRSIGSTLKTALTAIAHIVAAFALMAMMMVIVANIVGRIFFRSPVTGTLEIVGFAGIIVVAIAVVFTERAHGNVAVDIVVTRLPPGLRRIFSSITYFLSFGTACILFWAVTECAVEWFRTGEATIMLSIRHFPFGFIWAGGLFCLCILLLKHFIEILTGRAGK